MRLDGRSAIVTGGGGGIGEAIATTYAREGAKVLVVDVDEKAAQHVVDAIRRAGGCAVVHSADLADPAQVAAMVEAAVDAFGRLDVLHNNAIRMAWGRVGELTLEGWQKTLDIGLTAYWYATRVALAHLVAQGAGVVLNTASVSALGGDYGIAAYNVVKAGVLNLTRATAVDYARKGIRCNAVCPGPIGTPTMRAAQSADPERLRRVEDAIPMGRFGTPQEIADVSLFLACDESSFITGAHFVVDGGLSAHTHLPSFGSADW